MNSNLILDFVYGILSDFLTSSYFSTLLFFFFPLRFRSSAIRENESRSVVSDSLQPYVLYSPWNSPHQILEWIAVPFSRVIFPTQGSNPGLHIAERFFTS